MTDPEVVLTVSGLPWPEGSLKAFVVKGKPVIVHDNPQRLQEWRDAVEAAARKSGASFLRRPVAVDMDLYLPRPKSHYRTGRNAHLIRDDAPSYPVHRMDVDKLARAVNDSLTGVLWDDDGQVVKLAAAKHWAGPTPGAIIRIWEAT